MDELSHILAVASSRFRSSSLAIAKGHNVASDLFVDVIEFVLNLVGDSFKANLSKSGLCHNCISLIGLLLAASRSITSQDAVG